MPEVAGFAEALDLHKAGRLDEAEQGYREVLRSDPRHAAAWKMLGVLARELGRVRESIAFLEEGLHSVGPEPKLYFHLGQSYRVAGDADAAIRSLRLSLTLEETDPEGHLALGQLLLARSERHAAIEEFSRSVELAPDLVNARFSLAVALSDDGQPAAAEENYRELVELDPVHAAGWINLGALVQEQGRLGEAVECFRRALAIDLTSWKAHFNLGTALAAQRDFEAAADAFQKAVDLQPDVVDAQVRLGEVLAGCGQRDRARTCFRRARGAQPDRLLSALRAECFGERMFASNDEIDEYRQHLSEHLSQLAEGERQRTRWQVSLAEMPVTASQPPTALIYQGRDDRPLKEQFACLLAGRFERPELPRREGKPRVAFVVTPEREGIFLRGMAGVLNHLDPSRLGVTLVCGGGAKNRIASMITSVDVQQMVLPARFADAVEMLRSEQFDLIYFWEVGTDAANYYLPMLRLAPVQCTSWGWPVTSGMDGIDYFVSSDMVEPPGAEGHYIEQLVRLRRLPLYYARPVVSGIASQRDRFGFSDEQHVYVCAQNPRKFHPDFDPLVRQVLETDPRGLFVLAEATPGFLTDELRGRFARTLGDVAERVRFLPRMSKGEFLEMIASADVVLDTPHYGGGANTTFETLALGKPLVTLAGEFHRGRFATGVLTRIGLDDFVTHSPDSYAKLAVALGSDAAWRQELAPKIARSAAVLFEDRAAVGELEDWFLEAIAKSRET